MTYTLHSWVYIQKKLIKKLIFFSFEKNTYTPMFKAALFTIAKTWQQP